MFTQEAPKDWDAELISRGGSFLQSNAWADFQKALGRKTFFGKGKSWQCLVLLIPGRGVRYLYAPYGPLIYGKTLAEPVRELQKLALELGADFIRMEPTGSVKPSQLAKLAVKSKEVQPAQTYIINLALSEADQWRGVISGQRNSINGADKRQLSFNSSEDPADIDDFLAMIKATSSQAGFRPHADSYYKKMAEVLMPQGAAKLFWAEAKGRRIAGVLGFDFGKTRHYAHAASYPAEARKLEAAGPLVWFMMMDAKRAGFKAFDFWGIAPADQPKHPWAGFSRFKRSFGGQQVDYAGTWDIPVKKGKYRIYRLAKKVIK